MLIAFYVILFFLSVFSYTLVDPNITLLNNKIWTDFRNSIIYWGYYRREITSILYIVAIILLFLIHLYLVKRKKNINAISVATVVGIILFFSYPFLSHDLFNYMFDAKIFTYYHENPYLHKALDYPNDQWTRFMHWTHRTYPYGPVFLVLTFIPSFFSFGKFIIAYGLFKIMFIGSYILTVYVLNKLNKKWALIFATHPFVIIEGLLNSHNDLISVCLGVIGIYYLARDESIKAKIYLFLSAGIKYITVPFIILSKTNKIYQYISLSGLVVILLYLSFTSEIQPWYFLTLFTLLPYYDKLISYSNIFFAGLLLSYYPYLRYGAWDKIYEVSMKHNIIIISAVINILFVFIYTFLRGKQKIMAK